MGSVADTSVTLLPSSGDASPPSRSARGGRGMGGGMESACRADSEGSGLPP
jgi:hypothetical protein